MKTIFLKCIIFNNSDDKYYGEECISFLKKALKK